MKNLRKPLMMGAVALVSIAGLAGCDSNDPDSPSNPANFPSQSAMLKVSKKWYPVVAGNHGAQGANCVYSNTYGGPSSSVQWSGDRWTLRTFCTSTAGGEYVTANADWVRDWITGSRWQ